MISNQRTLQLQQIQTLLAQWSHLPAQGSQQWLDARKYTIGGSELHDTITNMRTIVMRKIDLVKMPSVMAMLWGTFMESTVRAVFQHICHCSIEEAGSIPSAVLSGKTYSMDGMGSVVYRTHGQTTRRITLFEFKCLFSRKLVPGAVPVHYQPQIKSGLLDLEICSTGLFAEAVFRSCARTELGYTSARNTALHDRDCVPRASTPAAYGVRCVYASGALARGTPAEQRIADKAARDTDYGREPASAFEQVIERVKTGEYQVWGSSMAFDAARARALTRALDDCGFHVRDLVCDVEAETRVFEHWARAHGKTVVAVMPWKLFDLNVVLVDKDPLYYTPEICNSVAECLQLVKKLNDIADVDARKKALDEYFYPVDQSPSPCAWPNTEPVMSHLSQTHLDRLSLAD